MMAKAIRIFYMVVNPFRRVYWFIVRPQTRGAKCLIECSGKFLLIRNTYGRRHWTLPGGYVKRGESFQEGAVREAEEEVGITMLRPVKIGEYFNNKEYKQDTVHVFYSMVLSDTFQINPVEISEARWFPIHIRPENISSRAEMLITMYEKAKKNHVTQ